MKDSGLPWIGKIPEEWEVASNKFVMKKVKKIIPKYMGEPILSLSMKGVHERNLDDGGKMPATFDDYQAVKHGNLLLCLFDIDVTPRCVGFIRDDGITSPAYSQYKVSHNNITKYYYYYYLMIDNNKVLVHLTKSLRNTINSDQFDNIKTVIPPKSVQQQIANFLDLKTAEIDGLIDKINDEIDTLQQYQSSVITQAVTKGLDPNVPMKDSGIEWVGEIPKTWEKVKFNAIYNNRNTKVSDRDYEPLSVTKKGIVPQLDTAAKTNDNDNRKLVRSGDFVINSRSDRRGSCGISSLDGSVSLINTVLEPRNSQIEPLYFDFLFHTVQFADEFYKWGHGIVDDLWTTNWNDMKNITLILPPKVEQQQIANFLDQKSTQIKKIIEYKKQQINQLTEYKSSLIFEYVTGKKQVPQMEGRN